MQNEPIALLTCCSRCLILNDRVALERLKLAWPTGMHANQTLESHWLPWASSNLRRNPFGELSAAERAELAVVDVDPIIEHVSQPRHAIQLIGDCGRGKTTRMLALQDRLPRSSYVYLAEDELCPAIPMGDPVLIDEAQRLPRAVRRSVWRSGLPLILATHRDLRHGLQKFGYRVCTVEIGVGNTPDLIYQLLNRRIEASRLHPGPVPLLSLKTAESLASRFGTDIRAIEHHLYEQLQRQVKEHGQVRSLDSIG